jgi:hypothetical protein
MQRNLSIKDCHIVLSVIIPNVFMKPIMQHHDIQHNDIQHNVTQHNEHNCEIQFKQHSL